ncbi:MAG: endonuclease VIII [Gammaproteobacteria bacterium]|nr:endonuclease VIII [Gammaproteobacteria bacterium]
MPEGPEIRRIADDLEKQIAGRVIDSIRFGLAPLKQWEHRLTGAKVNNIETYGKAMVIRLQEVNGDALNIYSHNQLYGRWHFCNSDDYPESKRQLRMAIDCRGKSALLYSASEIAVLSDDELLQHPFLRKLGPDVLSRSTTSAHIVERLSSARYRNRQLGAVLTDQSFVAGLGNYLRCEILFYSSLQPKVRSSELDENKLYLLAETILKLARQSYQTAGITNDLDHAQQLMKPGEGFEGASFEEARFYVFRRQGLPCYRCGSLIEKISQAGQACFCCPRCQKNA